RASGPSGRGVRVAARERGDEALVDESLHPGISLLAHLDDRRALDLAIGRERHRHAYRAVNGVVGEEGDRPDVALLIIATDVESVEVVVRRPAGLVLDRLALGGRQPHLAHEVALRARE